MSTNGKIVLALMVVLTVSVLIAVVGRIIVFMILRHKGVPASFFCIHLPGYLASVCLDFDSKVSASLLRLARVADIALVAVLICAAALLALEIFK
ncbi:hypothetical protein AB6713_08985 [Luteimonas sp. B3_2_R+30]|uniref:YggT family protein n=1 Tax=Luteimonas salinilitoris TaxID=3237697 RepID=A0ABV4HSV2_9GAMM